MTALLVVRIALAAAGVLGVAYVVVAGRLVARQAFSALSLVLTAVGGVGAAAVVVLPVATSIARADLPRAPAAFLVLLPLIAGFTALLVLTERPRAPLSVTVGVVTLALLPSAAPAVGAGTVGAAVRVMHTCEGNLKAVGRAFGDYRSLRGKWPAPARWVDNLIVFLPAPKGFRCPARQAEAYRYSPPTSSTPDDAAIIACPHAFLGKTIVLRKDLRVEVRPIEP